MVYYCCFAKRGCHSAPECQRSFTCKWLGVVFLMGKETGFSPRTVSTGIPTIICDSCPLLASCMSTERKQSNPRAYTVGGATVQSRYLIVPLGTEIGKWWLLAHQVPALQYIVTGLANTERHRKQQPTIILNTIMPIRVQCQVCI